jgi:ATP-dependent Clp protease ATP-binding subunit ClpC
MLTSVFDRFTDRARSVVRLSEQEARGLRHNYIGTEHILLGLVRENGGVATRVLLEHGVDAERVRTEALRMLATTPGQRARATLSGAPMSVVAHSGPPVLRLMRLAAARALEQDRSEITTDDVLVALTRAEATAAVLRKLGVDEDAIERELGGGPPSTERERA